MKTYGQFCAMGRALEVIGERWTLLVVRELMSGSTGYNEIRRGIPAIPRDTLAKRLRTLERAKIATRQSEESGASSYHLTPAGEALAPLMIQLASWSLTWDDRGLLPEHLDPKVLLWDIHRRINPEAAPGSRVTIEFTLSDRPPNDQRMWLVVNQGQPELCRTDGGYTTDLYITTTTHALASWWLGELDWNTAVASGDVQISGLSHLSRAFPGWFLGYALAPAPPSPE